MVTFNGNATSEGVDAVLQRIAYRNSAAVPPAAVQIDWTFNDGNSGSQGSGGARGVTGSVTVDIVSKTGTPGNDTLTGGHGNDTLDGGAGADTMAGHQGNDTYVVDNVGDAVVELPAEGTDTVQSSITCTLTANVENLVLTGATAINGIGNTLNNAVTGNSAANTLNGGAGADTMAGGVGNDIYYVDNAGDVVSETSALVGSGTDLVYTAVNYSLGANVENLRILAVGAVSGMGNALGNLLYAGAGNNVLDGGVGSDTASYLYATAGVTASLATTVAQATGGSGSDTLRNIEHLTGSNYNDRLTGNSAANVLSGNAGNDTLSGGLGNDSLTGGTGADLFRFITTGEGLDLLSDFASGTDQIQVVGTNFAGLALGSLNPSRLVAAGTALVSGNAVFLYNQSTGALSFDRDGKGAAAAVQIAILTGSKTLVASDIQVVAS